MSYSILKPMKKPLTRKKLLSGADKLLLPNSSRTQNWSCLSWRVGKKLDLFLLRFDISSRYNTLHTFQLFIYSRSAPTLVGLQIFLKPKTSSKCEGGRDQLNLSRFKLSYLPKHASCAYIVYEVLEATGAYAHSPTHYTINAIYT